MYSGRADTVAVRAGCVLGILVRLTSLWPSWDWRQRAFLGCWNRVPGTWKGQSVIAVFRRSSNRRAKMIQLRLAVQPAYTAGINGWTGSYEDSYLLRDRCCGRVVRFLALSSTVPLTSWLYYQCVLWVPLVRRSGRFQHPWHSQYPWHRRTS